MTIIVAAAGGGNWTVGGTWVGGVAPTAADDAQLTVASGSVTIDAGAVARSLDCTGYVGTLTHTAGVTLTLGDATAGASSVALKLVAGMTYTLGNVISSVITFVSTSATQQTITTAGKPLGSINFNGSGASHLLSDGLTIGATATMTLFSGTFNTGNFAVSLGLLLINGTNAKTLTLGSSAIAITGANTTVWNVTGSNVTFTANTAVVTCSGANAGISLGAFNYNGMSVVFNGAGTATWAGTGSTLNNVTRTGTAVKTDSLSITTAVTATGTLTVTGNSTINRVLMSSNTPGTVRTVTVGTGFSFTNVDFMDITAAGAAGTWTGTSMGNALGNTSITFDAPATQTRLTTGSSNWSDVTFWTSRVPLPQDNVVIGTAQTGTLTADMPRLGADILLTVGFGGTVSFASVPNAVFGSVALGANGTYSGTQLLTLSARSAKTITSNGKTLPQGVNITAPGGTYTLVDAVAVTGLLNVTSGAFTSAGFAITAGTFIGGSGTTVTLGSTTMTLTSTAPAAQLFGISAGATFSGASSTIVVGNASANARTILLGSAAQAVGTITYTVVGSTGSLTFTTAGTIGTLNFSDASNARSLLFTAGTTTTISTLWNVNGTAGKLMTVDSATAATHTLSKPSGTVSSDYLSVAHSIATGGAAWYAGANSTDAGSNTGWIFTAPPSGGADSTTRLVVMNRPRIQVST